MAYYVEVYSKSHHGEQSLRHIGRFETLEGIDHYSMGGYIDSLKRAARWVAHSHSRAPPTIMGTHSHWPMLMPRAKSPRWASGSRKYSAMKRIKPYPSKNTPDTCPLARGRRAYSHSTTNSSKPSPKN